MRISYKSIKTAAAIGVYAGIAMELIGSIAECNDLSQMGRYVVIPTASFYLGTEVAEAHFRRDSDLEKKLE